MSYDRTIRTLEILSVFKIIKHKPRRILDFGYGDGQITNALYKKGFNIIGLDISKGNYRQAKNSFPECDFRLYDGTHFPFEKNYFDTIILNDVLEHIPYRLMEELIEKLKIIIKPKGIIYISVTNRYDIIEPHTKILLLTWFPKIFWIPIERILKSKSHYHISDIYPYTFRRLKKFCRNHNLLYKDFTSIYILHKFMKLEYIGNRGLRLCVRFLKKIRAIKFFFYLAYKFSVIIFVCKVNK